MKEITLFQLRRKNRTLFHYSKLEALTNCTSEYITLRYTDFKVLQGYGSEFCVIINYVCVDVHMHACMYVCVYISTNLFSLGAHYPLHSIALD